MNPPTLPEYIKPGTFVKLRDSGHNYCSIPKDYAPIYSGDWKDSLVERPQ